MSLSKKSKIVISLSVVLIIALSVVVFLFYQYWKNEQSKVEISFDNMDPTITISEAKSGEATASYDFKLPKIVSVRDKEIEKKLKKIIDNPANYEVQLTPNYGLKNGDKVRLTISIPDLQEFNIINEVPKEIKTEKTVENLYDYDAIYTIDSIDCNLEFNQDWFGENKMNIKMTGFAEITDVSPYFNNPYTDLRASMYYNISYKNLSRDSNEAKEIRNGDEIEVTIIFLPPKDFKSADGNNTWTKTFTATGITEKIKDVNELDAILFSKNEAEDKTDVEKQIKAHYGLIRSNLKSFDELTVSEAKYYAGTGNLPYPFAYDDDFKIVKVYEYSGKITLDRYIKDEQVEIKGCIIKFWRGPIYDGTNYHWSENGDQSRKYQIVKDKTLAELTDFGFRATYDDVTEIIKKLINDAE